MATERDASGTAQPVSLRQRKRARTRAALIAAALELFERQGYEATTIDEIAAAADVSPRTFFRYFATKEEVALGDDLSPEILRLLVARPADEPMLESARHVVADSLVLVSEDDREALLARLRIVYRTPSLRARRWSAGATAPSTTHRTACTCRRSTTTAAAGTMTAPAWTGPPS